MALTKVAGDILDPGIVVAGIVTATGFSGPFSGGTDGSFSGNVTVGGNLTVNGDYTTLNTTLREVEILRVDTNSSTAAGIITQTGSGDILKLFDNTTEVFKVADGGNLTVTGQTTIAHTASPQLILKDSDTSGVGDSNGISLQDSGGTEYGFIGQASTGDHSLHVATKSTTNPVRIQVNGTTRLEAGNSGVYVTGVLDVASGGASSLRGDVYIPDKIIHLGDDNTAIRFPANDTVSVETSGKERLYIKSDGKIGINTTTPHTALEVQGDGGTNDATITFTRWGTPGNDGIIGQNFYRIGTDSVAGIGAYRESAMDDAYIAFHTQPTGGNYTERLRITSDGKYYFTGTGGGSGSRGLEIDTESVGAADEGVILNARASGTTGRIKFQTNSATAMTILGNGGNVGIGTDNPSKPLTIEGTAHTDGILIHAGGNHSTAIDMDSNRSSAAGGLAELNFKWNGTTVGQIGAYAGADTTNKDDGHIHFGTASAGSIVERLRIKSDGNLKVPDDGMLEMGTYSGGEMRIYHSSSNINFIDSPTNRQLQFKGDGGLLIRGSGNQNIAQFTQADGCDLYHNQTLTLETTSSGITVTGEVAASQDYPNIRPTLDFNFAAVKKLDPRIVYERTGAASYTDEFGKVVLVGPNVPRFDHDPYTGESKGLLIEESRTNLMKSHTYKNVAKYSYGSNSNGAIVEVSDDVLAPDGSAHTLKLHWTNYTATHNGYIRVGNQTEIGTLGAATYGFSFFVKRGTDGKHNMEEFLAGTATGIGDAQHHFTIQEFSPASSANVKICNNSDVTIDKYPDGWYRLSGTITTSGSSNPDNTGASYYVLGNSNFKTFFEAMPFYHWGFQLEVGGFPTSYIGGTVSATTTRGADLAYIDGQDFTDAYNVPEGTFVLKQSVDDTSTSNQWGWGVEKSTNRSGFLKGLGFRVGGGGAGYVGAWYVNNGSQQAFFNMDAGATVNIPFVSALAYKVNDMAATTSGMTVATDTSASIVDPGEFDRFVLGGYHYDTMSTGHIQRVMYYKKRLSNTQLVTLTS